MLDKVLIALGVLASAILIVENMVNSMGAYLFLDMANTGVVIFFSILIGMAVGYGLKGKMSSKDYDDNDEYDY